VFFIVVIFKVDKKYFCTPRLQMPCHKSGVDFNCYWEISLRK